MTNHGSHRARRAGKLNRLVVALAAGFLFGLAVAGSLCAQDEAAGVTLVEYRALLAEAKAILDGGAGTAVDEARRTLEAATAVLLDGGETVELAPILGEGGSPLPLEHAQARVGLLIAQLDASAGDNLAARLAVLDEVLQRPEFALTESPWDRFWRWVNEQLARILPARDPNPVLASATSQLAELVGWAVVIAGAIAIVWLLAYWLRGLVLNMVADVDARRQQAPEALPQTPGEARRRAETQAQAGNYREAVRNLYLSALLTLEQHGIVSTDRSLTNREVLALVAPDHPIRPHLRPVVDTFDDVWYGVHEPDQGTFGSYSRAIDKLAALAAAKE